MHIPKSDFFPKLNNCFWADVCTADERLRLFAHIHETKWVASVYNMRTKLWVTESARAKNAQDAKSKAETAARDVLRGTYEVEWQRVGGHGP